MKNTTEEYIQPPSYVESQKDKNNPLISKLQLRINQDLNQINGVYDSQIAETEKNRIESIKRIEEKHQQTIDMINKQRERDIADYHKQAESRIDNLISSMGNSPQKVTRNWWEHLFG